jgi:glutathione S-transferase
VPVLKLENGQVIDESRDIMFWALGQNDPENWLAVWRQNPALAIAFLDRLDGAFKHDLDRYKYASRYDRDGGPVHRDSGAAFLTELDQDLQQTGALSGPQLGLLDFASLPFVRQFRIADPNWFDNQSWPQLHAWLGGFLDSARFQLVMQKYPQWSSDGESIFFPPQP